jgi:uncharacterized protein (TIGR03067 family)
MTPALFTLALTLSAPGLKDKPKAEADLVGEWAMESATANGATTGVKDSDERWVFTADGKWVTTRAGKKMLEGKYFADRSASPAELDLELAGQARQRNPCIFRVEGDTLTLNYGSPLAGRPTTFDAPRGAQCTVLVFKRAKKE